MSFKERALLECLSDENTTHHGGKNGRPFWNLQSLQFMYAPRFQFAVAPACKRYLFTAKDCLRNLHTFEAETPTALLSPIWNDIPEGMVELKVEAINDEGEPWTLVGARTFYKSAPFQGTEYYPPKARSYRECAVKALDFAFSLSYVQHWLTEGTPDPEYDFNVYPSKTIPSIIRAMITYAKIKPEMAEDALQLAKNAADFLLSIRYPDGHPLAYLTPTYYVDFRKNLDQYNNEAAVARGHAVMMIYPAGVGSSLVALEEATRDAKYLEAAIKIAEFYRDHLLPNGSWHLFVSATTGESLKDNYCLPYDIMKFMTKLYARTGDTTWKKLEENCWNYILKNCLETYNWEGQFEDSAFSSSYSNLSHHPTCFALEHILENKQDDEKLLAETDDLMRFIEDQFVVWKDFAPAYWNHWRNPKQGGNIEEWYTPAVVEQYYWAMPVDASASTVMKSFIQMYKFKKDPIFLAKARVLADMLTRMQDDSGFIPSQWMRKSCIEDREHFWLNCLLHVADDMLYIAEFEETL